MDTINCLTFIYFSVCVGRYATVAKRVNVKKLKTDLWGRLDSSLAGPLRAAADSTENAAPHTKSAAVKAVEAADKLSFQAVVNDISLKQEQKDVSLSFYFICLLHLANEKVTSMNQIYSNSN